MKYTVEIELDIPRPKVIDVFNDPQQMTQWQPDLVSFEHLSGEPGKPGSKSILVYNMGKRVVKMVETITKNDLPFELTCTYETKGVYNSISNRFEVIEESKTLWISENEFQFTGFMRLIGIFMKGSFPKQTLKFMNQFKEFAEKN